MKRWRKHWYQTQQTLLTHKMCAILAEMKLYYPAKEFYLLQNQKCQMFNQSKTSTSKLNRDWSQCWLKWGGRRRETHSPCLYLTPAQNSSHRCWSSLLSHSLREETSRSRKHYSLYAESFAAALYLLSRLFVYMTGKSVCWHLTKLLHTNIRL